MSDYECEYSAAYLRDHGYQVVPPTVSLCCTCKHRLREWDYFNDCWRTCSVNGTIVVMNQFGVRARVEALPAEIRQCAEYEPVWEDK